ncbi:MAG: hypothetical protein EA384_01135 [Spirochaetaceae bacterium]|nr:MAG: hypothetical protein EA384_01135 [Spirochaetaceae bacterium]
MGCAVPSTQLLQQLLPPIRRARDCYLYTQDGRRIIDLYRCDGAALLGYRIARIGRAEKQRLSEGVSAVLPSLYAARLQRALAELLPSHPWVRLFGGIDAAQRALDRAGYGRPLDPAVGADTPIPQGAGAGAATAVCRPFLPTPRCGVLLPRLPYPAAWAPQAVCFGADPGDALVSQAISPVALAGAVQAVAAWRAAERARAGMAAAAGESAAAATGRRGRPPQRPQRVVPELELERADCRGGVWLRRGPYLSTRLDDAGYRRLRRLFLQHDMLIAPQPGEPTVLPPSMSPGEFKLFAELSNICLVTQDVESAE